MRRESFYYYEKFNVVFKITLLSMFLLTSCSDDDDDVSSSGLDSDAGLILEEDGIKYCLTGVGDHEYTYDVWESLNLR